jgi:hypothetical protein
MLSLEPLETYAYGGRISLESCIFGCITMSPLGKLVLTGDTGSLSASSTRSKKCKLDVARGGIRREEKVMFGRSRSASCDDAICTNSKGGERIRGSTVFHVTCRGRYLALLLIS